MPLDGIVVKNLVYELNSVLLGGRIDKIYQPGRDEIIIAVRSGGKNVKLLLTSNASFPRVHITGSKSENPQAPPMFCMTLRKYLSGGKITGFIQPAMERIVEIRIESLNEMGDLSEKRLVLEIMGKHSNIILINEEGVILDAARRVGLDKSSVREVLPGREYSLPPDQGKLNPLTVSKQAFIDLLTAKASQTAADALYKSFCGISPLAASEICARAGVISGSHIELLDNASIERLYERFAELMEDCANNRFAPEIIYDNGAALDYSSIEQTQFDGLKKVTYSGISALLEDFYSEKAIGYRLKQKTADLRKLLLNNIERCVKKRDVLEKTLKDTENMNEFRICGELLTSFLSIIPNGAEYADVPNYHEGDEIKRIRLRTDLTPAQNASRYFEKYNKAKRQKIAVTEQISFTEEELQYLQGVYNSVFNEITENEIQEIRQELYEQGYIKKSPAKKGIKQKKSEPLHFVSSDGFDIFVGKNNRQNDELTLKFAGVNDIWLHVKDIPGSHVILKTDGKPPSDTAIGEAALLAAYYSRAKDSSSVPVDYTQKRNVKKPNGAKPGMVIYEKNKTAYVTPLSEKISIIRQL